MDFKVFLCHSSQDKPIVRTINDNLSLNDLDTWIDESELAYGDDLENALLKALDEEVTHFLIFLSPTSVVSPWVRKEIKRATENISNGFIARLIPILLRECEIPEGLSNLLYADLTDLTWTKNGDVILCNEINKLQVIIKRLVESIKVYPPITEEERSNLRDSIKRSSDELSAANEYFYRGLHRLSFVRSLESEHREKLLALHSDPMSILLVKLPSSISFLPECPQILQSFQLVIEAEGTTKTFEPVYFCGYTSQNIHISFSTSIIRWVERSFTTNDVYQVFIDVRSKKINLFHYVKREEYTPSYVPTYTPIPTPTLERTPKDTE